MEDQPSSALRVIVFIGYRCDPENDEYLGRDVRKCDGVGTRSKHLYQRSEKKMSMSIMTQKIRRMQIDWSTLLEMTRAAASNMIKTAIASYQGTT